MAAESNTQADIGIWVEKVIESCDNYRQTHPARTLVHLFEKRLVQDGTERYIRRHLTDYLYNMVWNKRSQILEK
jgi:hypothetical protein